jgi:hypothetical protein
MLQAISLLFFLFYTQFPIRFSWRYCLRSSGHLNQNSTPGPCRALYLRGADFETELLSNSWSLRSVSCNSPSPTAVYRRIWLCQLRYVVFYIRSSLFLYTRRTGGCHTKRSSATTQAVSRRAHHEVQGYGSIYVANVVDKVALRQFFFPPYVGFPLSVSFNQ